MENISRILGANPTSCDLAMQDLSALQRRAAREGILYQTLIGNVLYKYGGGFLKEAG